MDVIIILIALIALALAALRWGVNSTDGINSPEWNADNAGIAFTRWRAHDHASFNAP